MKIQSKPNSSVMSIIKSFLATGIFIASTTLLFGQSATQVSPRNSTEEKSKMKVEEVSVVETGTNGLYNWQVTHQPIQDAANALEAARVYKTENPEAYRTMAKDPQQVRLIPYSEFQQLSPEKQLYIHQNQQFFQLTDIPSGE